MRKTDTQHDLFLTHIAKTTHYKYNAHAHNDGIFIEIGQWHKQRRCYPTNSYWFSNDVKLLVYGNEYVQYYFKKDKLWRWISEHTERVGEYKNGQTRGISLSLNEANKLADLIVQKS
jgi:hypothetical protein